MSNKLECKICKSTKEVRVVPHFSIPFKVNMHGKLVPVEDIGNIIHTDNINWGSVVFYCYDCDTHWDAKEIDSSDFFQQSMP